MADLATRISDLTAAIRTKINAMMPRLLPQGGTAGQVLAKVNATDYNVGWVAQSGGGGVDPWTWQKLAANSTVATVAFANVAGMSFPASANTTYLIDVFGAYETAAITTGIAIALDIPAGASIIGQPIVNTTATSLGGLEQIADATTTGVSTGVRAVATNTPISARFVVAMGATAGDIQLIQRSEIAASNTILKSGLTIMGRRLIA